MSSVECKFGVQGSEFSGWGVGFWAFVQFRSVGVRVCHGWSPKP